MPSLGSRQMYTHQCTNTTSPPHSIRLANWYSGRLRYVVGRCWNVRLYIFTNSYNCSCGLALQIVRMSDPSSAPDSSLSTLGFHEKRKCYQLQLITAVNNQLITGSLTRTCQKMLIITIWIALDIHLVLSYTANDQASVLGVPKVHINMRLESPFRAIHSIANIWQIWLGIAFGAYTSLRPPNISEFIQTVHVVYHIV